MIHYIFKKLATVCVFALALTFLTFSPPTVNATSYPQYLYGDSNVVLVYGHMGYGIYVDKSSVVNQYYNPPIYQLAANVITCNASTGNIYSTETNYFRYDIDDGSIYISSGGNWSGPLYDRSYNDMAHQRPVEIAKTVWKAAYNMSWRW